MRKIWCFLPVLLLAGCSKAPAPTTAASSASPPATTAAQPGSAAQPAPAADPTQPVAAEAPPPAAPVPETVIASGTRLHVRLSETIDTRRNRAGDAFEASLSEPIVFNGETVLPVGTQFRGRVTQADASGRLKGRAVLALTLESFNLEGRDYRVRTSSVERVSAAHKKRNLEFIGGGSAVGAIVGAIAGGGKGAAIGAAAGGGAGLAGDAATGKEQVSIAAEAPLTFSLQQPLRMNH